MQSTQNDNKNPKFSFKGLADKLKDRDEVEVRSRLRFCVNFALVAAAAYMLCGAELFFSTFPLPIALLCSHRKKLLPISVGIALSALTGQMPPIYIFTCIATLLLRVLLTSLPPLLSELHESGGANVGTAIIRYAPHLPEIAQKRRSDDKNVGEREHSPLFEEKLSMRALTASAGGLLGGIFSLIGSDFSIYSLWGTLTLTAVCPFAVILLGGVFSNGENKSKLYPTISLFSVGALCVFAARDMTVIGMPMSPFIAMLLSLSMTEMYGLFSGGAASILFGLVLDPVYMPLLLICSLLFFLISTVRRGAGLAVVCAAVVIWCYYIGGTDGLVSFLPPMLLAIPIYMISEKYRELMYAPYNRAAAMAGGVYFAEAVTEKNKNEAVRERLGALSDIFATLSETFYKLSDKRRRPDALGLKKICESELDSTCRDCRNREICYGGEYKTLIDATGRLTVALRTRGICQRSDLDAHFLSLCSRSERLISNINQSLARATENMIKGDKLGFFASSYEDINEILRDALESDSEEYATDSESAEKIFDLLYEHGFRAKGVVVYGKRCKNVVIKGIPSADKLSAKSADAVRRSISEAVGSALGEPVFELGRDGGVMRLSSKPLYRAKCAMGNIAAERGESEPVLDTSELYIDPFRNNEPQDEICGDTSNSFITSSSYFYSLISDGMGNGEEAAFVSGVSSMFIEKMLSAGNRADITVRMLNNLLRNENMGRGGECSATVDLCELDLLSGTASFIKSGAAPTYIARSGTVYKVYSRTMPIGILKDADTKISKFDTKKGDIIIMLSDGCCPDSEDCPWLVEYLCDYMSKKERSRSVGDDECEVLKDKLLSLALKNSPLSKARDDISVSVIMIE